MPRYPYPRRRPQRIFRETATAGRKQHASTPFIRLACSCGRNRSRHLRDDSPRMTHSMRKRCSRSREERISAEIRVKVDPSGQRTTNNPIANIQRRHSAPMIVQMIPPTLPAQSCKDPVRSAHGVKRVETERKTILRTPWVEIPLGASSPNDPTSEQTNESEWRRGRRRARGGE
jgi:hypothetical protein